MSTTRPEITVAMPAYNAAAHLREAMDSILSQTFEDLELLVVDDGSTDNTLALATAAAANDSRVRIERLPANRGRATARNMALGRARGRYIAWMDADDISLPHRLEMQHACLEAQPDKHICGAGVEYFGYSQAVELFAEQPEAARAAALFGAPVPNGCSLLRLDAVRGFGLRYDAALVYSGGPESAASKAASPVDVLVWLDTLWQVWVARNGHDTHMQRHIAVFAARALREAAAEPQQAQAALSALQGLGIAGLM